MIIDASVAFKLVVEEPDSGEALAWIGRGELVAPTLVHAEVGNALWKRIRKGELTADDEIGERLSNLGRYLRTVDETDALPRALELAVALKHPVNDCVYLALAEAMEDELLTADRRFVQTVEGTPLQTYVRELGR
ncbi:MAG TPA: type II toxin-antitoxin system VapC family toxin [Allosphingosinicella sp.]|nr:type II toxin-antitoxin system VapC family toxin [Allosphingosinicella sp.]